MIEKLSLNTYDVLLGPINEMLTPILNDLSCSRIAILTDENTHQHCLPLIQEMIQGAHILSIQSGESHKSIETCQLIWKQMREAGMDRNSLLINLGGGVIGDMGGFAASCYMRGMRFIQIPTTLLSQVDASVGGKLGVDFMGLKNFIGLFQNPLAVLIDPAFLKTLPNEELRSGYAEMIKHGLISNEDIWNKMVSTSNWKKFVTQSNILESVNVKKGVVEQDSKELGLRKILNFGHTIGHALESLSFNNNDPLLHGEAIALGMIAESYIASIKCGLTINHRDQIVSYLKEVYSGVTISDIDWKEQIMPLILSDKKNTDGKILLSTLNSIGNCTFNVAINQAEIYEAITFCQETMQPELKI